MRTTTVIIGAGHAGLAMSRHLTERSIDHVVLERSEVASSWRRRWDSLRLLTPNWQTRLPGHAYAGPDPDGFMHRDELVRFIEDYATRISAPVHTHTEVRRVRPAGDGYVVETGRGTWRARNVVIASGAFATAKLPRGAETLPASVHSLSALQYRRPAQLPEGGVLVVGASATGVQLALELQRAGRDVTLAVGHHVRMPRRYRGRDVQWWMHHGGLLDTRFDEVDDLRRARSVPSPQLVGDASGESIDLNVLSAQGVRLAGRFAGVRDSRAMFSGSLDNACKLADQKLGRMLSHFDVCASEWGIDRELDAPTRPAPTSLPARPTLMFDLAREGIGSVLWATGFRPDYGFLDVPVFDPSGQLRHSGGVVDAPGLYLLGGNFTRRRKSSFIHGADDDARDLADHMAARLARPTTDVAPLDAAS